MIGVLHSGILSLVINATPQELHVAKNGDVFKQKPTDVFAYRLTPKDLDTWESAVIIYATSLQYHIQSCERCNSEPLSNQAFICFGH